MILNGEIEEIEMFKIWTEFRRIIKSLCNVELSRTYVVWNLVQIIVGISILYSGQKKEPKIDEKRTLS